MALGGSHSSRSARTEERERGRSRLPTSGLARKSSVTSTTSNKAPSTSSSWFSLGRRKQPAQTLPPSTPTLASTPSRKLSKPHGLTSSRSEPLRQARQPQSTRDSPSAHGLGVTTAITSDSTRKSSAETHRTNTLRRKPSGLDHRSRYAHTETSLLSQDEGPQYLKDYVSSPEAVTDPDNGSVFGVALPSVSASSSFLPIHNAGQPHQATSSSQMASFNAHRTPKTPTPQLLPPLAPSFANSSGSSTTRRSESPGSFSRTSTPTSISSYSPGIPATTKSPLRARQISPTRSRPPVTRNWPGNNSKQELGAGEGQGLSVVQELATSSSSSDTVRGGERYYQGRQTTPISTTAKPPGQGASPLMGPSNHHTLHDSPSSTYEEFESKKPRLPQASSYDSYSHVALSSQIPSKTPPPRPSREGTPRLEDVTIPSPIIKSNLSRLETTGHKRRESLEKPLFPPPFSPEKSAARPLRSTKPSRLPSPNPAAAEPSRTWPTDSARSRIASRAGSRDRNVGRSPTLVPTGKPSSRFGLFSSRRTSPVRSDVLEKPVKKGPAAGTGHEGYGKYAHRGRSGSSGTNASRGRSTSSNGSMSSVGRTPDSRKSSFTSREGPEMDDFLRDRLSPVIISGGRVSQDRSSGAELYRPTSSTSSASIMSTDAPSLRATGPMATQPKSRHERVDATVNTTTPSRRASGSLPRNQDILKSTTTTRSVDKLAPKGSTLAARRSMHRDGNSAKVPAAINSRATAPSPAMSSRDTIQSSALCTAGSSQLGDDISEGREGNWLKSKKAEKASKPPSKWNFFQRATAAQKKPSSRRPSQDRERPELPVSITRLPESRSVAHYAMIDNNGQDVDDPEGLIPRLQDVDYPVNERVPTSHRSMSSRRHEHKQSMLLPSPPTMAGEFTNLQGPLSPKILLRQPALIPQKPADPPKTAESRLQQVGRIPRVVSRRDRPHKPPPHSFSRPFSRGPAAEPVQAFEQQHPEDRPILGIQTEVIPSDPWEDPCSAKPASAPPQNQPRHDGDEFLIIPQRHDSELSGSSSSGVVSFVLAAADPPKAPQQEDIWREYDDFIDTVQSPASQPTNPSESRSKRNSPPKTRMTPAPLQIRKNSNSSTHSNLVQDLPPITHAPAAALPDPPNRATLLSPNMASSPMSFTDFIAGYGDRNRSSAISKRQSSVSGSHYSQPSARSSVSDEHKRHTQIMAEKTRNSSGQSNLRFSALMTSRWLSFGRVLFSPAHDEIQTTKQDRVLVLDGLGNDDWSFYCALTYPDATVYNLSSFKRMGSASARKKEQGTVASPPNHRQIFHAGMSAPFPFPKGYFSAAVFRFPAATTETAYYNAVSECKRVLRPGGFLEVSILDLDMVNMGNRCRRAVRGLKTKMQVKQRDVSLKPASDNIQKMLGRRGFENLNRCMVTVPVAGLLNDSRKGSLDAEDKSLGEMLKDHSAEGDEGITKMVSRVGRWWYSRCYESQLLGQEAEEMEGSIWNDRQLLKECEGFETGLKLLICYAQKPSLAKRRTISL